MRFLPLAVCLAALLPCRAHDPITTKLTWSREISRIVYRHCTSCHHAGGAAMSLVTYEEARPWAKAIRDEVLARRMPPWGAVKGVGQFRDDPSLSQIEIDLVVNWVEGGAPAGEDIYLPPGPAWKRDVPPAAPAHQVVVKTTTPHQFEERTTLEGVRPLRLVRGASLEVTAYQPDGRVRRLIWIRNWRPEWQRTYYFVRAIDLPKGTQVVAYSGDAAEVALVLPDRRR